MKASVALALPLVASALASPVAASSSINYTAELVSAVGTISSDLTALNNSVNKLSSTNPINVVTALQIQGEDQSINFAVENATAIANSAPQFSLTDSFTVGEAFLHLTPTIYSVLNNLIAHKPQFATAILELGDLSQTVYVDLKQLNASSAALGNAVTAKLDPTLTVLGQQTTQQIIDDFNTAIAAYQSCTGAVCLPPF